MDNMVEPLTGSDLYPKAQICMYSRYDWFEPCGLYTIRRGRTRQADKQTDRHHSGISFPYSLIFCIFSYLEQLVTHVASMKKLLRCCWWQKQNTGVSIHISSEKDNIFPYKCYQFAIGSYTSPSLFSWRFLHRMILKWLGRHWWSSG